MNLACEDGNLKLLDFVSIADIDAKECVGDSLVEILNQNTCQGIEGEVS